MRKLTTKEIVLLIALVFIVSGALYYNYFYTPYQEKLLDLELQIATSNQRLLTLQNEQQSIIRDTEKLNNELAGVEEEFYNIPQGIDEPDMLVFIEETLQGYANSSIVRFLPDISLNQYYQSSQISISFLTTYPNLKIILDTFYNAPFRNRIVYVNLEYQEPEIFLGPQLEEETEEEAEEAEESVEYYLYAELTMECYTIPAVVTATDYPFMIGPYNNTNPFETLPETPEETEE
jgi:hypothetical protein